MIKRATFHQRTEWCQWLRWHTIDPNTVLVSCEEALGFIEIDTALYRVRFLSNDNGRLKDTVVQLEASPTDFPRAVLASFYTDVEMVLS